MPATSEPGAIASSRAAGAATSVAGSEPMRTSPRNTGPLAVMPSTPANGSSRASGVIGVHDSRPANATRTSPPVARRPPPRSKDCQLPANAAARVRPATASIVTSEAEA